MDTTLAYGESEAGGVLSEQVARIPRVQPPGYESAWRASLARDDRRQIGRRSLCCQLILIDDVADGRPDPQAIPAECLNVSDGGLYGIVPIGFGVARGQRYTFRLLTNERGPEPGSQVVSQQGVIIRTELLVGADGTGDRVGVAVRLCGQRRGVVPMPLYA